MSFDLFVTFVMTGATLAVLVILARGAQADLAEGNAKDLIERLAPSSANKEVTIAVVSGAVFVGYFGWLFIPSGISPLYVFTPGFYETSSVGWIVHEWLIVVSIFTSGIFVTHFLMFGYRQIKLFSTWANHLEVDLMHTEDYQIFTLQPMRYLLITVVFLSLNIIAYQILTFRESADTVISALGPLMFFMFLGCVAFLKPVRLTRDRIKEAKENEMRAVREALAGDRSALQRAQIAHVADEFGAPDLMMYEQYVRSIWEWPVQGNIQRLLLYVLLPPLAWVLAALVERIVDSVL